ncbi:MAG: sensor histidine kinase KdpD [SAR324 cluster bacterium]|nr:sensor histidine kinase KdpD [SAR324 cluster bacterium]
MNENYRRDPEYLLQTIKNKALTKQRGQLKIFLGMCPGVGKTYSMLESAQDLIEAGKKVVIGLVETHGRKETKKLLDGMICYPLKTTKYHGTKVKEMDLDGLLKLSPKPDLVIVDELAHQNIDGSRHLKRYQDIEELLSKGFNVYTTVNIQHIESRNDQVAQITGVVVRETVPDSFFDKADEMKMIDLSPSDLLTRLDEGKVYLGERADWALNNFFQEEKLTALRELALRFTAERVDRDLSKQMASKGIEGPWNTNERFLVAVSSNPYSGRLIRAAKRMAYRLDAPWIALYVDTGENLSLADQKNLELNLNLAKELGAEMVNMANVNINKAIQKVCSDHNVTQIVIGRPDRRFIKDRIAGGTVLDQLVHTTSNIDIHVLRAARRSKYRKFIFSLPKFTSKLGAYFLTILLTIGISILFYAVLPYVGYRSLGSGFLLALLVLAVFANRGPTFLAAFSFSLIWYFFFINPTMSIRDHEWQDNMMVISFFVTAIVGGWLTSRVKYQESLMAKRESRTALLYEFTNKINRANEIDKITKYLTETIRVSLESECYAVVTDDDGTLNLNYLSAKLSDKKLAVANWTFSQGERAGKFTHTLAASDCFCYPITSESETVGVFIVVPSKKLTALTAMEDSLLNALASQAANTIKKIKLEKEARTNHLFASSQLANQKILSTLSKKLILPTTKILKLIAKLTTKDKKIDQTKAELTDLASKLNNVVVSVSNLASPTKGATMSQIETLRVADKLEEILATLDEKSANHKS